MNKKITKYSIKKIKGKNNKHCGNCSYYIEDGEQTNFGYCSFLVLNPDDITEPENLCEGWKRNWEK